MKTSSSLSNGMGNLSIDNYNYNLNNMLYLIVCAFMVLMEQGASAQCSGPGFMDRIRAFIHPPCRQRVVVLPVRRCDQPVGYFQQNCEGQTTVTRTNGPTTRTEVGHEVWSDVINVHIRVPNDLGLAPQRVQDVIDEAKKNVLNGASDAEVEEFVHRSLHPRVQVVEISRSHGEKHFVPSRTSSTTGSSAGLFGNGGYQDTGRSEFPVNYEPPSFYQGESRSRDGTYVGISRSGNTVYSMDRDDQRREMEKRGISLYYHDRGIAEQSSRPEYRRRY